MHYRSAMDDPYELQLRLIAALNELRSEIVELQSAILHLAGEVSR